MRRTSGGRGSRSWRRLVASVAERPLLCVAMTFYWLWINLGFQMPVVFRPVVMGAGISVPSQLGPLFASAAAYLAISVWFARSRRTFKSGSFVTAVCVAMSVSSAFIVSWLAFTMAPSGTGGTMILLHESMAGASALLYATGSVLFGASSAFLCIELQRIFGSLGSEHVLFHGSVAMLVSVSAILVLSFVPEAVQCAVFVLAPLPIAPCLLRVRRGFTKQELFGRGVDAELNVPYKLLVTALLHGVSLGVLLGNPLFQSGNRALLACAVLGYAVAAALILAAAISARLSFNTLIYQIGFPIIAVGIYLIATVDDAALVGVSVQLAGFCFLHLVMWGACAFLIRSFDMPASWVIGTSTCLFMLGQLVGGVVSAAAGQFADASDMLDRVNVTMLLIVLGAALCMMSSHNLRTGWGLAKPDTESGLDNAFGRAVAMLASDAGLTKREGVVLAHVARGKNRQTVSEELCISKETAKSHMQSIYRKVGVHSQQELISYLEERARRADDG